MSHSFCPPDVGAAEPRRHKDSALSAAIDQRSAVNEEGGARRINDALHLRLKRYSFSTGLLNAKDNDSRGC